MRIVIDGNPATIAEFAGRLSPVRLSQALSVAVNDTARQVRTRTIQLVTKESSLPRAVVARGIRLHTATPSNLQAMVEGTGRPVPLREFKARQTKRGVVATVWGERQFYAHAFIVQSLGGHAYVRQGRGRLPIHKMYGAGIAQVMSEQWIAHVLVTLGRERLSINVARQLDRYVAGAGGAGRAGGSVNAAGGARGGALSPSQNVPTRSGRYIGSGGR